MEQLRALSFQSCDAPPLEYSEVVPEFPAVWAATPPCSDWLTDWLTDKEF